MLSFYLAMLDDPEDQKTFKDFYETFWPAMYRAAYSILKDKQLTEDAVHNAFLVILKQMKKVKGFGKKQAYIFAVVVARDKAIDLWRKEQRYASLKEAADIGPSFYLDEDKYTTILDELPELYRNVLLLLAIGFKPKEIALIQNKDIRTIYKEIDRGKKMLLEKMKEENDGRA